jgi:hypothetical protein
MDPAASPTPTGGFPMTRRIVLLTTLAVALAACGSGDTADSTSTTVLPAVTTTAADTSDESTTSTTSPPTTTETTAATGASGDSGQLASIKAAISQSAEITSGRIEGLMEISAVEEGVVIDISIPFGGEFDSATGNSSFVMDLSGMAEMAGASGEEIPAEFAGMFDEMEVRVVDGVSYIKFPLFGMMFGAQTEWISAPEEEGTSFADDFTFARPDNPAQMLEYFEDAEAEVTEVGRETVNGVETTHYRVVFDAAAMLAAATPEERAEMMEAGPIPDGEFPMDLWITDDGVVVRYVMDIDGSMVESDGADEFQRMVMTFNLLDFNQPVNIVAPDPDNVTDIESLGAGMFGMPQG